MNQQTSQASLRIWGIVSIVVIVVIFGVLVLSLLVRRSGDHSLFASHNNKRLAVIEVKGPIFDSEKIVKKIRTLDEEDHIAGVILRINSPGGAVAPSQEIYEAMEWYRNKHEVPIYVSMGTLAASGGYWIALVADRIYANPGSLTGSIGVLFEHVNLQDLFHWLKIKHTTLKSGKYKDVGNFTRSLTAQEQALLENVLKDVHTQFKSLVVQRRGIDPAQLERLTEGQVFTGKQAMEYRLVDRMGGFQTVVEDLRKDLDLPEDTDLFYPDTSQSFAEWLTDAMQTMVREISLSLSSTVSLWR